MPRRRALGLCIMLAGASGYALLGAAAAWQQRAWLDALPLAVPPIYLGIRPALAGAAWAALTLAWWRGWRWARPATLAVWAGLFAWDWAERLWLAPAAYPRLTWGWSLAVDAFGLALLLFLTRADHPALKP